MAVHPGALGDVILFGQFLKRLGGEVTLAAGGAKARLLAGLGAVQRALDFDSLPMHEVFMDSPADRSSLPALLGRHDRLVSCFAGGNGRAERALPAMCGATQSLFLPVRPKADFEGHLLDLWADLAGLPRLAAGEFRPWPVQPSWREQAGQVLVQAGVSARRPYVVIHPGAGAADKCWPAGRFAALAELLRQDRPGLEVVCTSGPVELERLGKLAMEVLRGNCRILPPMPLETLAGVLAGCSGFVGNDSGPAHLAAAVGAPAVVVTSPASRRHFLPVGPRVAAVEGAPLSDVHPREVLAALGGLGPEQAAAGSPSRGRRGTP